MGFTQKGNCFSVRSIQVPASLLSFHSCKQYSTESKAVIDAADGSWVEMKRKRWHGGREWCVMWCKLGLKDTCGTRLMLFDSKNSLRARYVLEISNDELPHFEIDPTIQDSDERSASEEKTLLTLPCVRATGTDCDRPSKVREVIVLGN